MVSVAVIICRLVNIGSLSVVVAPNGTDPVWFQYALCLLEPSIRCRVQTLSVRLTNMCACLNLVQSFVEPPDAAKVWISLPWVTFGQAVSHLGDVTKRKSPYPTRAVWVSGSIVSEIYQYFSTIGPLQAIGILGFFTYVIAFGSVQIGRLDGNSAKYSFCNVLAASFVSISLIAEFNLASALIQGCWIVIGLIGLSRRLIGRSLATPAASVSPLPMRDLT